MSTAACTSARLRCRGGACCRPMIADLHGACTLLEPVTATAADRVDPAGVLGSGIWNVRPPMIMRTFVESVDLGSKTILPFVTYAVSGLGRTIDDYTRLCPRSTIGEGLAVRGEEAQGARAEVE